MSERIHTDADREAAPAPEAPVDDGGPVEGDRESQVPPATHEAREGADEAAAEPHAGPERELEARLAAAEAEAARHLDHLQRLAAEFDNFRKRAVRDQEALVARAHERLVKELLPVLDDLERALEAAEEHEGAKLEEGVRLVHRALAEVLRKEGVSEIGTEGAFDPHVHEALLAQPSDEEEGTVIEVLQKGYRVGDRVLRPSRVVVAAAKEAEGA